MVGGAGRRLEVGWGGEGESESESGKWQRWAMVACVPPLVLLRRRLDGDTRNGRVDKRETEVQQVLFGRCLSSV